MIEREVKAANEPEALLWVNTNRLWVLYCAATGLTNAVFMVRSMLLLLWQYKPLAGRA